MADYAVLQRGGPIADARGFMTHRDGWDAPSVQNGQARQTGGIPPNPRVVVGEEDRFGPSGRLRVIPHQAAMRAGDDDRAIILARPDKTVAIHHNDAERAEMRLASMFLLICCQCCRHKRGGRRVAQCRRCMRSALPCVNAVGARRGVHVADNTGLRRAVRVSDAAACVCERCSGNPGALAYLQPANPRSVEPNASVVDKDRAHASANGEQPHVSPPVRSADHNPIGGLL